MNCPVHILRRALFEPALRHDRFAWSAVRCRSVDPFERVPLPGRRIRQGQKRLKTATPSGRRVSGGVRLPGGRAFQEGIYRRGVRRQRNFQIISTTAAVGRDRRAASWKDSIEMA